PATGTQYYNFSGGLQLIEGIGQMITVPAVYHNSGLKVLITKVFCQFGLRLCIGVICPKQWFVGKNHYRFPTSRSNGYKVFIGTNFPSRISSKHTHKVFKRNLPVLVFIAIE